VQKVGKSVTKTVVTAGEFGIAAASVVVPAALMGQQRDGTPRAAGFVVFKSLYAKNVAMQIIHLPDQDAMKVHEAPPPDEIYWDNVTLQPEAKRTGRLFSLAATCALFVFWTAPVAVLSSFTEVHSLKQKMPKLADMVERMPSLELVLALIAPLLLLILQDLVLPEILKIFAKWEGHISFARLEASIFLKLAAFMVRE